MRVIMAVFLLLCLAGAVQAEGWGMSEFITAVADTASDSTIVSGSFGLIPVDGARAVLAAFYLTGPYSTGDGEGADDSCWLWLYTDFGGHSRLLDSAVTEGLPCTLLAMIPNVGDTLLWQNMRIDYKIYDSIADTPKTLMWKLHGNYEIVR